MKALPPLTGGVAVAVGVAVAPGGTVGVAVAVVVAVGVGVEVGVAVAVAVGVAVGVFVLSRAALNREALPCASIVSAVRLGAAKAPASAKEKAPSAAALVRPRKMRPWLPLSAKISTVAPALAWPMSVLLVKLSNCGAARFAFAPLVRPMPVGRLS